MFRHTRVGTDLCSSRPSRIEACHSAVSRSAVSRSAVSRSEGTCRSRVSVSSVGIASAVGLFALLMHATPVAAQTDYQWQDTTTGGTWSTPGNWLPTGPASGSLNTADFSTLTVPVGGNLVHLDTPETIGSLIFGDVGNANSWTLDNNSSATNILTLAGNASITVNNQTATISAVITGTQGLNFTGPGTLVLSGVNTYTGTTTINSGILQAGNASDISTVSAVSIGGSGTYALNGLNQSIGSLIGSGNVTDGAAGTITLTIGNDNTNQTFSGAIANSAGTLSLTKTGSGLQILSGTNT